jgi:hypothetical protein
LFTFAQDSAVIDSLIKIFLTACLFLGGQIHRDPVATYFPENLKNIGILELSSSNGKDPLPPDSILYTDTNGHDKVDTWNFRSVVGKLITWQTILGQTLVWLCTNVHINILISRQYIMKDVS